MRFDAPQTSPSSRCDPASPSRLRRVCGRLCSGSRPARGREPSRHRTEQPRRADQHVQPTGDGVDARGHDHGARTAPSHRATETIDAYLSEVTKEFARHVGQGRPVASRPDSRDRPRTRRRTGAIAEVTAVILQDGTALGDQETIASVFEHRATERDQLHEVVEVFDSVLPSARGIAALEGLKRGVRGPIHARRIGRAPIRSRGGRRLSAARDACHRRRHRSAPPQVRRHRPPRVRAGGEAFASESAVEPGLSLSLRAWLAGGNEIARTAQPRDLDVVEPGCPSKRRYSDSVLSFAPGSHAISMCMFMMLPNRLGSPCSRQRNLADQQDPARRERVEAVAENDPALVVAPVMKNPAQDDRVGASGVAGHRTDHPERP